MDSITKTPLWSSTTRQEYINETKKHHYDVIIIGGGITGAGIARELALRDYSFLIVDKNDFAFGTSSRSSKLAHGGIRYLANRQFKVVRESCTERNWMLTHIPHLVRPHGFNMVAYSDYLFSQRTVKLVTKLYHMFGDTLSKFKNCKKPQILTKEEFIEFEPAVRKENLIMGGYYYDTNVDDARLTLETIKEALLYSDNNSYALNYVKAEEFLYNDTNQIIGIKCLDEISKDRFEVKGTHVINATGIWTDELLKSEEKIIRPTKGVHLVIPNDRLGNTQAFVITSRIDKRGYFVIRREKFTIIGTTDTDFKGNLDKPICTKEDCDYLLDGVNYLFPNAHITEKDLISTYAGVRPLVLDPNADHASAVSRKHELIDHPNGLISLIGGKLTIFRLMGEQLVFHLIKKGKLPKPQRKTIRKNYSKRMYKIGISKDEFFEIYEKGVNSDNYPALNPELIDYLHRQYGKQAFEILEIIKANPTKGQRFYPDLEFTPAEIEWIVDHEFAPTLLDVINRRTEISLFIHHSKKEDIARKIGLIMQEKYGWSDDRLNDEIQFYVDQVDEWLWF